LLECHEKSCFGTDRCTVETVGWQGTDNAMNQEGIAGWRA
jgi:hypothetical protein